MRPHCSHPLLLGGRTVLSALIALKYSTHSAHSFSYPNTKTHVNTVPARYQHMYKRKHRLQSDTQDSDPVSWNIPCWLRPAVMRRALGLSCTLSSQSALAVAAAAATTITAMRRQFCIPAQIERSLTQIAMMVQQQ